MRLRLFACAMLIASAAPALTVGPHDAGLYTVNRRGIQFSEFECLETGVDAETGRPICTDDRSNDHYDFAAASETRFETSGSPGYIGNPYAEHRSEITATALGGAGFVTSEQIQAPPDEAHMSVESLFSYGFTIDEPARYHLGALLERPVVYPETQLGSGYARLEFCAFNPYGCGASNRIAGAWLTDEPPYEIAIEKWGELPAGAYRIDVAAGNQQLDSIARWSFALEFFPVPEPSTAMLLGLGMTGLAVGRRCRTADG